MSIWISERAACLRAGRMLPRAGLFVLLSALAGCAGIADVSMGGGGSSAPRSLLVADQSVRVAGPPGYCIDPQSLHEGGRLSFILLGSCASISGRALAPAPARPAVLTASVAARGVRIGPLIGELPAYFASEAGRAALARDGKAESVRLLDSRLEGDLLLLHARDSSPDTIAGLAPEYWRALFDLNGRLITLSIHEFAGKPLPEGAALKTLRAFAERMRRINRAVPA